ncbi:hypothetical protein V8C44DRAFT_222744 [Trichoderma aethiopicum]
MRQRNTTKLLNGEDVQYEKPMTTVKSTPIGSLRSPASGFGNSENSPIRIGAPGIWHDSPPCPDRARCSSNDKTTNPRSPSSEYCLGGPVVADGCRGTPRETSGSPFAPPGALDRKFACSVIAPQQFIYRAAPSPPIFASFIFPTYTPPFPSFLSSTLSFRRRYKQIAAEKHTNQTTAIASLLSLSRLI